MLHSIDDVPHAYATLIQQLHAQEPIVTATGQYKVQPVADRLVTRAIDAMINITSRMAGHTVTTQWYNDQLLPQLECRVDQQALYSWTLSHDVVVSSFVSLVNELKSGWTRTTAEVHPSSGYLAWFTDHYLFKRTYDVFDMDRLIRFLVTIAFGDNGHNICRCEGAIIGQARPPDYIVLVIKKDQLQMVDAFFQFGLSQQLMG